MNLRERAHFAYLDRLAVAESNLHHCAIVALRDVLGDQSIDGDATKLMPFSQPAQAFYTLEDLDFRVNVKTAELETEIDVAVCRRQAFVTINNIGDLGQVFKDETLPEPEPEPNIDRDESERSPSVERGAE